ncbi:hypothetical protein BFP72_13525 [Reichenbachiella sp. 5M10]|uniref:LamG-like jellyroll fold domain-containing protein n=1 Tax=Reichenbachiella sp. 5M10 TaxID=1889772 RepID=UPI000C14B151|nr:LamG-like jellyroll fold domain-containing protein [Reichenbachiella sp. 5M10]PIB36342.1 hypothetical protein BFP72_13525 [Reichenbachiella sp. 5M10]
MKLQEFYLAMRELKKYICLILFILVGGQVSAQDWTQIGSDLYGEAASDDFGFSVSLSADGASLAVGALENDGAGVAAGHVRVYGYDGSAWVQKGLDIDGVAAGDRSGYAVSLSSDGTRVAIGDTGGTGHVRVFDFDGVSWVQTGADIDGAAEGDRFGESVELSRDGTRVAVGASGNDTAGGNAGHVRVFEFNGTNWVQLGLAINGAAVSDQFGRSVSFSSDASRLAIGADCNGGGNTRGGYVSVFDFVENSWQQVGTDIEGNVSIGLLFGSRLSMSANGDQVAIGAYGASVDEPGFVQVYHLAEEEWSQQGTTIFGKGANDYAGSSVALSSEGTRLAVGAMSNDDNGLDAGHVRVFEFTGGDWGQLGSDLQGAAPSDRFGVSVSFSSDGKRLAIGADSNDGFATDAGSVQVYENMYEPVPVEAEYKVHWSRLDYSSFSTTIGGRVFMSLDPYNDGSAHYVISEMGDEGIALSTSEGIIVPDGSGMYFENLVQGLDGSYYALINFSGTITIDGVNYTANGNDPMLIKYSSSWEISAVRHWTSEGEVHMIGLDAMDTGEVLLSFWFDTNFSFDGVNLETGNGAVLAKLNSSLNLSEYIYTPDAGKLELTSDQSSVYLGAAGAYSLRKYDTGVLAFAEELEFPVGNNLAWYRWEMDSNGDVVFFGQENSGANTQFFLGKQNIATGDWYWHDTYGGLADEGENMRLAIDNQDRIYIASEFYNTWSWGDEELNSLGGRDLMVGKLTTQGELIWMQTYGSTLDDNLYSMALKGENVLLTGYFSTANGVMADKTFNHETNFIVELSKEPKYVVSDIHPQGMYGETSVGGGFRREVFFDSTTNEITIEFLLKPQAIATGEDVYMGYVRSDNWWLESHDPSDESGKIMQANLGGLSGGYWISTRVSYIEGFALNKWGHYAITYKDNSLLLYYNGRVVARGYFPEWENSGVATALDILTSAVGSIDELRVWSEARTLEQVRDLCQTELTGEETNLKAYWDFNSSVDMGEGAFTVPDVTFRQQDLTYDGAVSRITRDYAPPVFENFTDVTTSSFVVNWEAVPDATGYRIRIAETDDFSDPLLAEELSSTTLNYSVTGLNQETLYYVELTTIGTLNTSDPAVQIVETSGNLLAYYSFSGNTNDDSGYENHGVLGDGTTDKIPVLTTDRFGVENEAYLFDGNQDYIYTDFTPSSSLEVTISVWAYWEENLNLYQEILGFVSDDESITNYFGVTDAGYIRFKEELGIAMPIGQWTHLVATHDNDVFVLYMNGQEVYRNAVSGFILGPLTIGAYDRSGSESWYGAIDDVRIYGEVLDANEVDLLYREGWETLDAGMDFLSFQVSEQIGVARIDEENKTIKHYISGTGDLTNQVLTYTVSEGATVKLAGAELTSGVSIVDFTAPVVLDVLSANGFSYQSWTVTVVKEVGLAAYYPLTGGSLTDKSGNGYDLILSTESDAQPVVGQDRYGENNAVEMDGDKDYLGINGVSGVGLSDDITFNVWMKPTGYDSYVVFSEGNYVDLYLSVDGNPQYLSFADSFTATEIVPLDRWSMLSLTRSGSTITIYLNGMVLGTGTTATTGAFIAAGLGGDSTSPVGFEGALDDVRLYDRALTAEEILSIYESEALEVDFELSETQVDENVEVGTLVGVFSPEVGTYSILSGSTAFKIEGYALVTNDELDYETGSTYSLTIRYDDGNGTVLDSDIEITVNNLNETPIFGDAVFEEVFDSSTASEMPVSISCYDPDGGDLAVYIVYLSGKGVESEEFVQLVSDEEGDFNYVFGSSDFGPFGLTYYYYATDGVLDLYSDLYHVSTVVPADRYSITVSPGATVIDYKMISVPFKSVKISEMLGVMSDSGDDVWRMVNYNGASYTELSKTSTMVAGKGYWFLNTEQVTFSIPSGTTPVANAYEPFAIKLTEGFNQIGNPYPFSIDWGEVLAHNGITEDLYVYDQGFRTATVLDAFEGGFYDNTLHGLDTLFIPTSAITAVLRESEESKSVGNRGAIGSDEWSFGLNIKSGSLNYNVSAVGMNEKATIGRDVFDADRLPILSDYMDLVFENGLTKNIVANSVQHKWTFDVNSTLTSAITLSWDNEVLKGSDYGLILLDVENQKVIDLETAESYTFQAKGESSKFELYYGLRSTLQEQVNANVDRLINPYPNPFNGALILPVATKGVSSTVQISMYDLSGMEIYATKYVQVENGYHEFVLNANETVGSELRAGTYLVRVTIDNEQNSTTFNKRVVYLR